MHRYTFILETIENITVLLKNFLKYLKSFIEADILFVLVQSIPSLNLADGARLELASGV